MPRARRTMTDSASAPSTPTALNNCTRAARSAVLRLSFPAGSSTEARHHVPRPRSMGSRARIEQVVERHVAHNICEQQRLVADRAEESALLPHKLRRFRLKPSARNELPRCERRAIGTTLKRRLEREERGLEPAPRVGAAIQAGACGGDRSYSIRHAAEDPVRRDDDDTGNGDGDHHLDEREALMAPHGVVSARYTTVMRSSTCG